MTKAIHSRILKDENGAISDHLRNHVHLTNCIHLKNHMHRHSPILADSSLMRDLVVLQRSRSLRDPSTSPLSWHSPSVIDGSVKKVEKDEIIHHGRRSLCGEKVRDLRRLSGNSLPYAASAKVAAAEVIKENNGGGNFSDQNSVGRVEDDRRVKEGAPLKKFCRNSISREKKMRDDEDLVIDNDRISEKLNQQDEKEAQKGSHSKNTYTKTLSEQLREFHAESEEGECSQTHNHARYAREAKTKEKQEGTVRGYSHGLSRVKKRKVRGTRRARVAVGSRDMGSHNELSVASNSLIQGSRQPKHCMEEREEDDAELEVTQAPSNGCGIPWNWSRIHQRGKTFLDIAGRSFSCGLSDSRLRQAEGDVPRNRSDVSDIHVVSNHSISSEKSDSEALPLLFEPSGSHENKEKVTWLPCDYSGELSIFANHKPKHGQDSDLASEARSGDRHNHRGSRQGRHWSLTQKYMPRTFKDLVGQNLAVQALSNAVERRKIGLVYVFYGPPGTGKTSCARIFARALNCQSLDHAKPCGACTPCIAHDTGKSRTFREVGGVGNFSLEAIMDILNNMVASHLPSQYRVLIIDDCDALPHESWTAISKVIDLAPRKVVFILVSTSLDLMPHIIISRCQKFFFPKLKDADIIYTLQWIATKEGLNIDRDALKLIASRSDGSLRDAEMTLDQLSLLGQKISLALVQELVGMISDEKLVDLLDLALSADTVNTVKVLREIMEAGVEPLALMSQLATIITDILAGSYVFTRERLRRKFFRRPTLSKEDMEKLRQALKTLSEAEKQLRLSNDRLTWLTAALLQLAPDKQYVLPSSSAGTSSDHSPTIVAGARERPDKQSLSKGEITSNEKATRCAIDGTLQSNHKRRNVHIGNTPPRTSTDTTRGSAGKIPRPKHKEIEEIWLAVLGNIQINTLKQLMQQEGKLVSVSFGAAPTVKLMFSSEMNKSKAEKFRGHILQAFESILGSPVTIEIRCESKRDLRVSDNSSAQITTKPDSNTSGRTAKSGSESQIKKLLQDKAVNEVGSAQEKRNAGHARQQSIVKSKVSLAHVIQQAEGQRTGWSKRKAISIAEKLEQENLRLEPRSRSLLCWKASRISRAKLSHLRIRTRRPRALLKLVSCSRCLCTKSPR